MIKLAPLALLLCATPALASETAQKDATETPAKPEKKVCKTERSTGSIMPKRTCRSKAEWDAQANDRNRMAEQDRLKSSIQGSR